MQEYRQETVRACPTAVTSCDIPTLELADSFNTRIHHQDLLISSSSDEDRSPRLQSVQEREKEESKLENVSTVMHTADLPCLFS